MLKRTFNTSSFSRTLAKARASALKARQLNAAKAQAAARAVILRSRALEDPAPGSKRPVLFPELNRDGTSQAARFLKALSPDYVSVDERSLKDLLKFAQKYGQELRYFNAQNQDAGDWSAFVSEDLDLDEVMLFMNDPEKLSPAKRASFSRPHFVLFLTFLKLLQEAQQQINTLTQRHLEFYYQEVLRMKKKVGVPDQVHVLLQLQDQYQQVNVPAGTDLKAGADSLGQDLIYQTDRDIVVSQARIEKLHSVFSDKEIIGFVEARMAKEGTWPERFVNMVRIALGHPSPGDPLPLDSILRGTETSVDFDYLLELEALAAFSENDLFIPLFDLRSLMKLKRQRDHSDEEWQQINGFLEKAARKKRSNPGFQFVPDDPKNFDANLVLALEGAPDYRGITQVSHIDHLYEQRNRLEVKDFIRDQLYFENYDDFVSMMQIKIKIDKEWIGINKILEEAGQRKRRHQAFRLSPVNPTDFNANLNKAVGPLRAPMIGRFQDIDAYYTAIQNLERHFYMSAEKFAYLIAVGNKEQASLWEWEKADEILLAAHHEKIYDARRGNLKAVRNAEGFEKMLHFALGEDPLVAELNPLSRLKPFVNNSEDLAFLENIANNPEKEGVSAQDWTRVYKIVEFAQRFYEGFVPPIPYQENWLNLYPEEDATQVLSLNTSENGERSPRWKTFGRRPLEVDPVAPPDPIFGWGMSSPMLQLEEGTRTITLTLGFHPETFSPDKILPLFPSMTEKAGEGKGPFQIEISTEKGWIIPDTVEIKMGAYAALSNTADARGEKLQALQFKLSISEATDPIAAFPESFIQSPWPTLRLMMRQIWNEEYKQFVTLYAPLKDLELVKTHVRVEVSGLSGVQIQNDGGVLDANKPFEPFGASPSVGSRFYIGHRELFQKRLDYIQFHVEWMGVPDALKAHYKNYGIDSKLPFTTEVSLVDRRVIRPLKEKANLFANLTTASTPHTIRIPEVTQTQKGVDLNQVLFSSSGFHYDRDVEGGYQGELSEWSRYVQWELNTPDFQHAAYPTVAASKSVEMAAAITNKTPTPLVPGNYQVNPPYTPKIKKLKVDYAASREVVLKEARAGKQYDRIFHWHPFGYSDAETEGIETGVSFLPDYDEEGALYIGIQKFSPPQTLSLFFQMAEGSADPDLEPVPVSWNILSGNRWRELEDGSLLSDSTRGLINSGIVSFSLKPVLPNTRLSNDLYWMRVSIPLNVESVCDTVAIHTQAVTATFHDQENAPGHLAQPLAADSITDLANPMPEIESVLQPYTSFGGKVEEADTLFYTRISERLRHKQRAVSLWDYEHLVLEHFPEIYKVKCLPASLGANIDDPGRVEIVVIPDIRNKRPFNPFEPKAPANMIEEIEEYLSDKHPPFAKIKVKNAHYIAVKVRFGVRFKPGVDERYFKNQLNDEINRFLSPWAYEEGADIIIGGKIYANSIINFIDQRPYVDYIVEMKLFSSMNGVDFKLALPDKKEGYAVSADRPDGVLVAAQKHEIDMISEDGYEQESFSGINYMKVELDFIVG